MPKPDATARPTLTYSQQYRRCGKPACSVCKPGGTGHGPYWYAYWWERDRMRSRYIGKRAPAGMEAGAPLVERQATLPAPLPDRPPALQVRTLGGFAVRRGHILIPASRWRRRKAADLFKCLLSSPAQRLHREQAIDQLWPGADQEAGAHSLRSTLHLLRRVLDEPGHRSRPRAASSSYVRLEGDWLSLAPALADEPPPDWLDALAFQRAADWALAGRDIAACRHAATLYAGDYLPETIYEDWAVLRREALRQKYVTLLLHLADLSAVHGEQEEAARSFEAVLAIEPCHESAAQSLMSLLAGNGRRTTALQVYQSLAARLRSDLGVGPSADTEMLHRRLLLQQDAPRAHEFAPRLTIPRSPTNLPTPLTSFVGRERERALLREILTAKASDCRLLTLTGAGGCGKTRLALEVARDLLPGSPDGVWLVELAALSDPTLVPHLVAQALGVREEQDRALSATLAGFLAPRTLLLVLDNCEHLIAACADLAHALLRACPGLQILATSREALAVAGEVPWRVPSLSLSASAHLLSLEELAQSDAVRLFVARGRQSQPDFALTARNAAAVIQICRRLDGMPLAIELAAARLSLLPVERLAERLDDRFHLLTNASRTAPPRQQTLRATMEWSYALLTQPERALLRRLAVFAGGWTPEAAEAVCAELSDRECRTGEPDLSLKRTAHTTQTLDLLYRLVAKSLVVTGEQRGEVRCWLLETVRTYISEQLAASDEQQILYQRHREWCLALAEEAAAAWQGAEQAMWLMRLEREHDNLLPASAAVVRAAQPAPCDLGLTAAHGYTLTPVVRGLPFLTAEVTVGGVSGGQCIGPFGVAFHANQLYVAAPMAPNGGMYRFPLAGGTVDKRHELNATAYQGEPVFDRGALYVPSPAWNLSAGAIVQLNPATGKVIRTVARNLSVPQYIAADPISGNLFFQDGVSSGPVTPDIWELSDPAGPHPTARSYVHGLGQLVNGMAFAPNGTLYAADGNGNVYAITGTRGPATPKVTTVVTLSNPTGLAIGSTGAHGQALSLWVGTFNGGVEYVNLASSPPTAAQVVTSAVSASGHIMGVNVGPDGCVYVSTVASVLRLARTHGGCAATK